MHARRCKQRERQQKSWQETKISSCAIEKKQLIQQGIFIPFTYAHDASYQSREHAGRTHKSGKTKYLHCGPSLLQVRDDWELPAGSDGSTLKKNCDPRQSRVIADTKLPWRFFPSKYHAEKDLSDPVRGQCGAQGAPSLPRCGCHD